MKTTNFKQPDYVYFVYTAGSNGQYGFSSYTDNVGAVSDPGSPVFVSFQTDKNNKPIPYIYSFSMRDRVIRVEANKKDVKGMSIVEYLRNSPECKNSPNGTYVPDGKDGTKQVNVMFKEMNEEQDAETALKAKEFRRKAENIAADLSVEEVFEINSLLGIFKTGEVMARHSLMEVAGNKPNVFMTFYEDPQRRALALVNTGINKKVLKRHGTVIVWNETTLGTDERDAAAKIEKDEKLFSALQKAIKS